ncbi:LecA/PA-IL family lectin [Xenorhabdus stockiae]|uniref:LecA/PA-IL family lectin n=1 Tax=Xenorhabdus stockiae TaxID=351614 RepID=UPI004064092E
MIKNNYWKGSVPADYKNGIHTGIYINEGDIISVVARGWIYISQGNNYVPVSPQGERLTENVPQPPDSGYPYFNVLVAKIGNELYDIGNGVLRKHVPATGELIFLFRPTIEESYNDIISRFEVTAVKEPGSILSLGTLSVLTDY